MARDYSGFHMWRLTLLIEWESWLAWYYRSCGIQNIGGAVCLWLSCGRSRCHSPTLSRRGWPQARSVPAIITRTLLYIDWLMYLSHFSS